MPPVTKFFGKYEHSLDAKGRVVLPAKMRARIERAVYLTPHSEGCIALWRPEDFQAEVDKRQSQSENSASERNVVRLWSASVCDVEVDQQGRMAIPADLRSFAGLAQEVVISGQINRVELWSPARWAAIEADVAAGGQFSNPLPSSPAEPKEQ